MYNSHTGIGRQELYLLEVGDFEFNKSNMDEVLTFPVKFRVTDPRTQIIPSYSVAEPTKIVALVEKSISCMAWKVYDKTGNTVRCTLKSLEYNGTWMGACFVTSTLKSAVPILFEIGDYVMYRGEKFEINYDPTALKKAAKKKLREKRLFYDNIKF